MTTTPRIRHDLQTTAAEDNGIRYVDVADPRSGSHMRMYDFEWQIAAHMDGTRSYDEVAGWATRELGIRPSANDLVVYAERLSELGFFEAAAQPVAPTPVIQPVTADSDELLEDEVALAPPLPDARPAPPPPIYTAPPAAPAPPPRLSAQHSVSPGPDLGGTGRVTAMHTTPEKRKLGSPIALAVVLLGVAAGVFYVLAPKAPARVKVILATAQDVVNLYDGSATIKPSEPQALSFGEAGKVSDIVAPGTEAKPGMPLATLEAFGKIEKDLIDVRDRAAFYEKQLQNATAKGSEDGVKKAQEKVNEKRKVLAELEARAAKVRLVAPSTGTVSEVLIAAGADAKPGEPVVKLGDQRLTAVFKLSPTDTASMKAGAPIELQPAGGARPLASRIARVGDGVVVVELGDDVRSLKADDTVRLVKTRIPNVVSIPLSALFKREGDDFVFLLIDGQLHGRKVIIVDRTPTEALIRSGISAGETVVVSGGESLHEGQKAVVQ